MLKTIATGVGVALCLFTGQVFGQIAVSSNDHKMVQENGVTKNIANPPVDTITVLDLGVTPVKVVTTISDVPGSVAGPPLSVAITPDESLALVASSSKFDPADPTKLIPDDRVTIVDLKDRKVLGQIATAPGAAGISITKDGKRAYVAHRSAGSISILSIDGKQVRLVKTVPLVGAASLVSHIALSPDGLMGVVTRNADAKVDIVKLAGDQVSTTSTLDVTPRPYPAVFSPDGKIALVGCGGDPKGGNGVLTVIDFAADPKGKIVGTVDIGYESLEGMMISSDGRWVAAVMHAGSTRPKDAPQYKPNGMVVLYRLDGNKLTKTSDAPIGVWSQGAAFSRDGTTLVVQNMVQHNILVFRNDNGKLVGTGQTIDVLGGAAAIRASTGP
jgi:DNA-binding beta-propeller fold protein YncE